MKDMNIEARRCLTRLLVVRDGRHFGARPECDDSTSLRVSAAGHQENRHDAKRDLSREFRFGNRDPTNLKLIRGFLDLFLHRAVLLVAAADTRSEVESSHSVALQNDDRLLTTKDVSNTSGLDIHILHLRLLHFLLHGSCSARAKSKYGSWTLGPPQQVCHDHDNF